MIKRILPFAKKYGIYALLSPIVIIGEVLAEIQIPKLMSHIVDVGIKNQDITVCCQPFGNNQLLLIPP